MQTGMRVPEGYCPLSRPNTSEGHDLGDQQRQQQAGGVQPQGRAVGRGHIDDGVYAIDVAEKGQQEPEYLPVLFQVAEGVADAGKALPDGMFLHLHKVHLFILAQQGQGGHQPPDGGDKEGKVQRCHLCYVRMQFIQHLVYEFHPFMIRIFDHCSRAIIRFFAEVVSHKFLCKVNNLQKCFLTILIQIF